MGLRVKDFNIFGFHLKIRFSGGVHEKPVCNGGLTKKGGLGQFANLKGVDTLMHTMSGHETWSVSRYDSGQNFSEMFD